MSLLLLLEFSKSSKQRSGWYKCCQHAPLPQLWQRWLQGPCRCRKPHESANLWLQYLGQRPHLPPGLSSSFEFFGPRGIVSYPQLSRFKSASFGEWHGCRHQAPSSSRFRATSFGQRGSSTPSQNGTAGNLWALPRCSTDLLYGANFHGQLQHGSI